MRVWWILKKSFKIKHCRKRSTGSNGELKIRQFVQKSLNFLMVWVLDLILPYQNSLHKLLHKPNLTKLPHKSRSDAVWGGLISPLRLWSLPAAVWVVVETWHLMTFPLASSGTCWWNFFVEKLHSLAAGPRQSRPIGVFFLYQKYKSRFYANFYVTNHMFWYQLQI